MSSPAVIIVLRLFHILGGVLWVGGAVFLSFFLVPTIAAVGPAGGPIMRELTQVRRVPIYLMVVAIVSILSGFALYGIDSAASQGAFGRTGPGIAYGIGAALAVVATVIGMAVNTPTAKRLGAIGAAVQASGGPPSPEQAAEMARLQAKLARSSHIATWLIILTAAAMAVGRYV